jgi:hypothetical protein
MFAYVVTKFQVVFAASAVFAELRELYAEQRTLYALVWRAMSVGSNNFPCGHNNDFVVVVAE